MDNNESSAHDKSGKNSYAREYPDLADVLDTLTTYNAVASRQVRSILEELELESIRALDAPPPRMLAVDGSHTFLLNISGIWLAVLRAVAVLYEFVEGDDRIGFKLLDSTVKERVMLISTLDDFVQNQDGSYKEIFKHLSKSETSPHIYLANELRRIMEWTLAAELAGELSDTIIALDGALVAPTIEPYENLMQQLIVVCRNNDNTLLGISKDSNTHAFSAYYSDEDLLAKSDMRGACYARAPEAIRPKQRLNLYGDVFFARLHRNASKWFRVDVIPRDGESADDVLAQLAHHSRSELCPGYPYPLLEAHRMAVQVRHLRELYQQILLDEVHSHSLQIGEVLSGLTNIDGVRRDTFHKFLDEVSRRAR